MSLKVITPDTMNDLKSGIDALEWLLQQPDTDTKSKEIYEKTLKTYKEKLRKIGGR